MAQENKNITPNSGEMSLKDVFEKIAKAKKYFISKWKIILMAGLIGGTLGLFFSFIKQPVYKAELNFALEDNTSGGGGLGEAMGLASQFGLSLGGDNGGGAFSGDNLLILLKSRSMVESALLTPVNAYGKNQTLAELYIFFNKYRDRWSNNPRLKTIDFLPGIDRSKFTLLQDSILGVFYRSIVKNNLDVEKIDKKLSIINVEVDSKNELFSKFFAEILVKTVSNFYIDTKTKKSTQNVNVLQHLADSIRYELNKDITGVASTSDVNPNPNPALQILRVPSQHLQVDLEANGTMLTEIVKNLELAKISLRKETPLIQIIDYPILPLEKAHLGKLTGITLGILAGAIGVIIFLSIRLFLKNVLHE